MKISLLPWRVRAPLYRAEYVWDEKYGWCVELTNPQPLWRQVLGWVVCFIYAAALSAAHLLAH